MVGRARGAVLTIDPAAKTARRPSGLFIVPTLAVLLVAGLWSLFWWFASVRAEAELDRMLAKQAEEGRVISCGERRTGGFPFRFELRCSHPHLAVTREDTTFSVDAASLLAVAQIYDPNHLLFEADAPLVLASPESGQSVAAQWRSAEASLVLSGAAAERLSLVVDGLAATTRDGAQQDALLLSGARLEAHARTTGEPDAQPGAYDVVVRLDAERLPFADAALGGHLPAKAEFQGRITGLTDLSPGALPERLREWSEAGGVLHIVLARVDRGSTSAKAAGDLSLDRDGRPAGRLDLTLAGVEELSEALRQTGVAPSNLANLLGIGLSLLGKPSSIDGRAAVEVPLTLAKGRARVGAFPAGSTPRFF